MELFAVLVRFSASLMKLKDLILKYLLFQKEARVRAMFESQPKIIVVAFASLTPFQLRKQTAPEFI
jgi:hypothetical protein